MILALLFCALLRPFIHHRSPLLRRAGPNAGGGARVRCSVCIASHANAVECFLEG